MFLKQKDAEALKRAIDAKYRVWRQAGLIGFETPVILVIKGEVVAGASYANAVLGAGHLESEDWPVMGAAVKGFRSRLDELQRVELRGYLHMHRYVMTQDARGPRYEAARYFAHPDQSGECSSFRKVVFRRKGNDQYPWRVYPA